MNVRAFPSAHAFFAISLEILRSLGRGLTRLIAYGACASESSTLPGLTEVSNPRLDHLRLCSAIDHLTRTEPVLHNVFSEPYIDRVNRADPAVLAKTLEELGYTNVDVETWRGLYTATAAS